ncbi:small, acid-soluble spore protein, alpha/beta type [Desulfotomaculum sp. 1211_IL3151]|uniref:small, acid-soluble spore protein, alpha/beta type n=1 Tax=Desulfotomaculum sp. 1211_IL3151 TaxID=3084055 RepID=UPI002FD922D3
MGRDKVMNWKMKHYAANQQGVEGLILGEHSDYGNLTSRQCGNFVKIALERANELV